MTPLQNLLHQYRNASVTELEKATYFEELIRTYFRHETTYADLYSEGWLYAEDYRVKKPAIEWVMERQAVTIDKKSGIKNDANLWATETMGNAKYPLELLLRVVTVSLETNKIVNSLLELEID